MKTSVIGYPRVGTLRELKFASEKYFRGEISAEELQSTAKNLRAAHLTAQKDNGTDFIPCNDFSFYDTVLDTAVLFGAVPARYRELGLPALDSYFAMARGYQGPNGDVKALAMKKWFNTNYHYMVPEIDDDTVLSLVGEKPLAEFAEAKALGIQAKPVVCGAFTFLKLARYTGKKTAADFAKQAADSYGALLAKLAQAGAEWVQFDEPALVRDLTAEDKKLFDALYKTILSFKGSAKVLLQTYFGDVRDCYKELCALPFDGIGLDFIEGRESFALVEANGFPKDKLLFAGLVNGKNIWKNNYEATVSAVKKLQRTGAEVVLSTSCSLLHVPYTLRHETKLPASCTAYFAFAEEKLAELRELKEILSSDAPEKNAAYISNLSLFAQERGGKNPDVQAKVAAIRKEDYTRLPAFEVREAIQKERFRLPLLPTTTIGSFPQTSDVKANRAAFKKGEITKDEYNAFNRKKIAACVALQEKIGLDVLVHGEFERNDMVEYFGAAHAGGDEDHLGALEGVGDLVLALLGGTLADLRVSAGAAALGQFGAQLDFLGRLRIDQRLLVGVHCHELDPAETGFHHAVDSVAAAAADTDHLDVRYILHLFIENEGHECIPLNVSVSVGRRLRAAPGWQGPRAGHTDPVFFTYN